MIHRPCHSDAARPRAGSEAGGQGPCRSRRPWWRLEDFAGLAFRGGDDDLESEARQHREGALRVTAVGLMSASSRNSVVYEGSLVRPPPSR